MAYQRPLVSVGVSIYNGARYIIESLDSINSQTYPNIEIYLIDDNSSDASYSLCKKWIQHSRFPVSLYKNDRNLGLTKNCDVILNKANGKYLQLFDQDDIMLPGKIEHDVKTFEKLNDDVAVIYSKVKLIDENGNLLAQEYNDRIGFDGILKQDVFAQLIKDNFIPAPTVMMRTDHIKKVGGYDESIEFNDWDTWLRVAKEFQFSFCDITNVYYRIHGESMMANNDNKQQIARNNATISMIKKHLDFRKDYDELLYTKLRQLSIYSYFLGDDKASRNFSWYLQNRFDSKVWLYLNLSRFGIAHPSHLLKRFLRSE